MGRFPKWWAVLLGVALPFSLSHAQEVRDLTVTARLQEDGSARITQVWEVSVPASTGWTEWYIPVSNLGKMEVSDLRVSEDDQAFTPDSPWDIHRSLAGKAGRCGIVDKGSSGVELCWGIGSYGDHVWKMEYTVTGVVKAMQDFDALHFQFVNDELAAAPQHVKVTLLNDTGSEPWTSDNTLVWAFGFEGEVNLVDGAVVAESSEPFRRASSVILLCRFEKDLFTPSMTDDRPFEQVRKRAFKGSTYAKDQAGDKAMRFLMGLLAVLTVLLFAGLLLGLLWVWIATKLGYKYKKSWFGARKVTEWFRDVPLEGNLPAAFYVLQHSHRLGDAAYLPYKRNLVGAYFLRWILDGTVKVQPDPKNAKRVILDLGTELPDFPDENETALYRMAMSAAKDNLLEAGEFETWSRTHTSLANWPGRVDSAGWVWLTGHKYMKGHSGTSELGRVPVTRVIEFQNFLNDFTLVKERASVEVKLWKDYLVYAQLYGIADRVASQFKKLFPEFMQEQATLMGMSTGQMLDTISRTNRMAGNAFQYSTAHKTSTSYGGGSASRGFGGHSSFGGGGGFSGGGHGGGGR